MDVAGGPVEGAGQAATAQGVESLTRELADLKVATFPAETYDAAYVHAALHHVFSLEHLLDQIKQTLKGGTLFVAYQYIGPSQIEFPRRDLELADVFLQTVPARYRIMRRLKDINREAFRGCAMAPRLLQNVSDGSVVDI